jgi:hypothetical protein
MVPGVSIKIGTFVAEPFFDNPVNARVVPDTLFITKVTRYVPAMFGVMREVFVALLCQPSASTISVVNGM